jgi:abortive infection bacteriophage resistance protein
MKYTKPPLTFQAQADLLVGRGMGGSREEIIEKLKAVNYYRLSAYWYTFRQPDDNLFPGTTIGKVWGRYTFDRQIRLLVMDAVERVEIGVRTQVVNRHSLTHGPFGYADPATLPGLTQHEHEEFLTRLRKETGQDKEEFVRHFRTKYTSETDLPIWMACELMTFGSILTLFRGLDDGLKKEISREYGVSDRVVESWLRTKPVRPSRPPLEPHLRIEAADPIPAQAPRMA